ncbi:MAG: hypothetical protein IPL91_02390 [Hyphomicrobium sp.]|nr:hypothetical protein [Hyphomicrobium sp.]
MTNPIITEWTPHHIEAFGKEPLRFNHQAHLSPLFSNETLADLIERTPRESYYVNTMKRGAKDRSSRREGEIRNLSGLDVLDAVAKGHIWIMLLNPEKVISGYSHLLDQIYSEFQEHVPSLNVFKKKISILISSPNIPVFYHCDLAGQTLWQVRGEKTVYVYPNYEPYLPQPNLEKIILNEAHEISLPYDQAWDNVASSFTIKPGDMLHWQLYAPHRIQNGNCVNVSFTTEHVTPTVRRNFVVNYANGILRRTLGVNSLSQTTSGPQYWSKLATVAAAKSLRLQKGREQKFKIDFTVDPAAPDCVRDIPAYQFSK